jgi:hypothetical protein
MISPAKLIGFGIKLKKNMCNNEFIENENQDILGIGVLYYQKK